MKPSLRQRVQLARVVRDRMPRKGDRTRILQRLIQKGIADAVLFKASVFPPRAAVRAIESRHRAGIQQAAMLGSPTAIYLQGMYDELGQQYPKRPERAAWRFKKAADRGHPRSMWIHALDRFWGTPYFPRNTAIGHHYLQKAIAAGLPEACVTLADYLGSVDVVSRTR